MTRFGGWIPPRMIGLAHGMILTVLTPRMQDAVLLWELGHSLKPLDSLRNLCSPGQAHCCRSQTLPHQWEEVFRCWAPSLEFLSSHLMLFTAHAIWAYNHRLKNKTKWSNVSFVVCLCVCVFFFFFFVTVWVELLYKAENFKSCFELHEMPRNHVSTWGVSIFMYVYDSSVIEKGRSARQSGAA